MLLIDAVYIHESGGKELLRYLIDSLGKAGKKFFLLLDERLDKSFTDKLNRDNWRAIPPAEKSRKLFYQQDVATRFNSVLCFANVPPPEPVKIPVFVFFQNALILSDLFEKNGYSFKQQVSFLLRKFYIRYRNKKKYQWIVQTPTMKARLVNKLGITAELVSIIPFFKNERFLFQIENSKRAPVFLYVADGVPQKNHDLLLDAWLHLYTEYNLFPELHVTVPERFKIVIQKINLLREKGLSIINYGTVARAELEKLYIGSDYMVFPSVEESFGLPLIEAATLGCKVIAADLPYVYDIIKPSAIFNPFDVIDMARVIKNCILEENNLPTEIVVQDKVEVLINYISGN